MITGMNREPTLPRRRAAYAMCAMVVSGVAVVGCGSGSRTSSEPDSAAIASSRAQEASLSSSRAEARSVAAADALCSQWFYSVVPMVNGYNQFVTKLNQVQEYGKLGGADVAALGQFDSGQGAIRAKLDGTVPQPVQDEVGNFLARTATLAAGIKDKDRFQLAQPAGEWTDSRHRVATMCQVFVTPTGTVTTMPSLPALAPLSSGASGVAPTSAAPPSSASAVSTSLASTSVVPTS